jgi:hypothetical protein
MPPTPTPSGKARSEEWWKGLAGLLLGARLLEYKAMAGGSFSYSALAITGEGQRLLQPAGAAKKLVFQVGGWAGACTTAVVGQAPHSRLLQHTAPCRWALYGTAGIRSHACQAALSAQMLARSI